MKRKQTICLNMIVKDEAHVVRRCLESVKSLIDYWVIVDTGSSDGTQQNIREYLRDIPGELHERPWVDFGHNRNEALSLARGKGDYFLFIDADDRLAFSEGYSMPKLDKDLYFIMQRVQKKHAKADHPTIFLIRDLPDFHWEGVLHEELKYEAARTRGLITGVINEYIKDGNRSRDPDRYAKDSAVLESEIQRDPGNSRAIFHLAQLYRGTGHIARAIEYYEKRSSLEGDEGQTFYSLYCLGALQRAQGLSPPIFMKTLCKAFLYRPIRAEPLFELAGYFITSKNFFLGYLVAEFALQLVQPSSPEFLNEPWMYDWGILLQYFVCASEFGYHMKAYHALQKLFANPNLPLQIRQENKPRLAELEHLLYIANNKESI